ncbi:hypothetical protein K503DRAFT_706570 [Rhizopogon vinicolor AM-OR11-026]|uniref:SP-RING-type domain-containing protein n=1 Tax=Rhizopogon vinicolor AM-OR11-026 TaxID=1314800 RepID=A0A1B7NHR5_9AGAM|nr:hypothetical protein K503DRAFT_706570 [Rhizopogon vinicolor AM-OR11-026]
MPVASSSKRKSTRSRREPSSDGIEDENPSQRAGNNDDVEGGEDEEEQPRRRVKQEKKVHKQTREESEHEDEPVHAIDDDEDDRIDIKNFCDQPLDKKEGGKLAGIAQDWEMIRKQIHQGSFSLVKDVANSLADVMEGDHADQALSDIDKIMKALIDIDHEMQSHEVTLSGMHQQLMRGESVEGAIDLYEKEVKKRTEEFYDKTTRKKYGSHEQYVQFKQGIFEVQNPGVNIPPINDFIPREEGDESDDEDGLEIGGVTQDFKCPITFMMLENPMTSSTCGHAFSGGAIRDYLKQCPPNGRSCPTAGCSQKLTMAMLVADSGLEKRVRLAARRAQRDEDNSDADDDEVIE